MSRIYCLCVFSVSTSIGKCNFCDMRASLFIHYNSFGVGGGAAAPVRDEISFIGKRRVLHGD